jgi:hypothetical protein
MAVINSTEYGLPLLIPPQQPDVSVWGAKVRCQTATMVWNSEAAGTINLWKIPKGARIIQISCRNGVSTGATTISIGDAASAAKFKAAAAITVTGDSVLTIPIGATIAIEGLTTGYLAETTVFATNNAAMPAAGAQNFMQLMAWYTFD